MKFKSLLFSFLILSYSFSFAQTGTIRGTVKDAKLNEDIIGATVLVAGTSIGAATDVNGFFSLSKVPAGKVKLILTFVSFKRKEIENVTVEADKITEVNTSMEEDVTTLQEVKVVATKQTNTEISVISEIKASQNIVTGISSQQIARTLDRDAAAVVKRVPGITIVGDRFINIRGLNQRYNNVMLHNAFTPSMETDVKSFSFDIIPSSQIDRLLIYKSPSAELPGEFAGGVVKIFTKNIPDQNSITFDYSASYRLGTTFDQIRQPEQGANYWTGFNNNFQNLPTKFPKNLNGVTGAELELAGRSLQNDWTTNSKTALPDQRFALSATHKFNIGSLKIGNVTSINYSDSRTIFEINRKDFNENDKGVESVIYNYQDSQNNRNIRVGGLFNWAVRINGNHSVEFKNLFNQNSIGSYVNRTGRNNESAVTLDNGSFDQVYRGIYSGQLVGKHQFNNKNTIVEWVGGYNYSYRDQPDYRRFRSDVDESTGKRSIFVPSGTAASFFLGRFSSKMTENAQTGSINLIQKVGDIELKFGGFYEIKNRTFAARNLGYTRTSRTSPEILVGTITQLFQPENINNTTGIRIDEQSNPSDSYNASNELMAGYAMANVPISKKINAIVGLRYEANTQIMNSAELNGNPVNVKYPVNKLLPSANLTYNFSEKQLLRVAYGRTVNRPEFRELAPFAFFDFDYNIVYKGNPNVQTANVDNFDFRYEWYPTPSEVVSFGGFYKFFTNPIEVIVVQGAGGSGGTKTFTFTNAKQSVSSGVEMEVRKGFGSLSASPILQKTSLLFNAALIFSKVNLGTVGIGQSDDRPLQGQSPFIVNVGLNYNDQAKDLQINVLYNVIGRRIFAVGFDGYPDIYEMPRSVLDLTFSKAIGSRWTLKGGITDILNQTNVLLQDGDQDKKFDRKNDQLIQTYSPGQTIQLGFSYRIK